MRKKSRANVQENTLACDIMPSTTSSGALQDSTTTLIGNNLCSFIFFTNQGFFLQYYSNKGPTTITTVTRQLDLDLRRVQTRLETW